EAFKKVISRRNIRRRITIPLTLSNLKLLRRITRTENILHRNFTRRQVAIQNRVASNIGISQSTFSVKVLNLFSRSRRQELLLLVYELNRSGLLAENEKIRPILAQLEKLLLCDLSPSTNDSVKN